MAKKTLNEEFPHFCVIRRIEESTPFTEEVCEIIYEGKCRRESSANIRTFRQGTSTVGQVFYGDHRVCIPGMIPVQKGDKVDVDFLIGEDKGGMITHPNPSGLKTTRYPEGKTEFFYSIPQV